MSLLDTGFQPPCRHTGKACSPAVSGCQRCQRCWPRRSCWPAKVAFTGSSSVCVCSSPGHLGLEEAASRSRRSQAELAVAGGREREGRTSLDGRARGACRGGRGRAPAPRQRKWQLLPAGQHQRSTGAAATLTAVRGAGASDDKVGEDGVKREVGALRVSLQQQLALGWLPGGGAGGQDAAGQALGASRLLESGGVLRWESATARGSRRVSDTRSGPVA